VGKAYKFQERNKTMLFKKNSEKNTEKLEKLEKSEKPEKLEKPLQTPQMVQVNLVDVVKQATIQLKYEEIGSWLATHNTPLFFCRENGFTIVDRNFIEKRPWLKRALNRMVKEIEEQKVQKQKDAKAKQIEQSPKTEKVEYIS